MEDLCSMSPKRLRCLCSKDMDGRRISQDEVTALLQAFNAIWQHPTATNPKKPHTILSGGRHSNGFVNLRIPLSYPNINELLAEQLAMLVYDYATTSDSVNPSDITWVAGSDSAALSVSYAVARLFSGSRWWPMQKKIDFDPELALRSLAELLSNSPMTKGYSEKADQLQNILQTAKDRALQIWENMELGDEPVILQVEELVTTSKTLRQVRDGLLAAAKGKPVHFLPVIPVIVFRPAEGESDQIDDSRIVPLARYQIDTWPATGCPLCQAGSPCVPIKAIWEEATKECQS